jgi:outer membrane protein insertion porin family
MLRNLLVRWLVGSCLFPLLAWNDISPPVEYEGRPIDEVRFDPPLQPVSQNDLSRILSFPRGTPLRLNDVRQAIKRLYLTGEYRDVEVSWELTPNGVTLVFHTLEQWFVGPVEVRGKVTATPNEGQLANAAGLNLGEPFEQVALTFWVDSGKRARLDLPTVTGDTKLPPQAVAKAAGYKRLFRWRPATAENTQRGLQNIREKYSKEERLTASLTLQKTEYDAARNRVKPVISADGGPKVRISTEGARVSKGNLEKYVPVFEEQTVNRDLLVRGVANLRDYFQNKGYFGVQVDFETRNVTPDLQEVVFEVNLGQRSKLVKLEIAGNRYFTTADILSRMYLQEAGLIRLRHGRYSEGFLRRDEEAIRELYRDNGFRDVTVQATTVNDYKGKRGDAAVTFQIEEGEQYRVGTVALTGITAQDQGQILSRLASSAGQPFSESAVASDRDMILEFYQSAGYPDASFTWRLSQVPDQKQVNLTYSVTEGKPQFVREVLISGLRETRLRLIQPNILLKPGDPLSWTTMGRMQRRMYNLGIFNKVDMAIQNPEGDIRNKYVLYHITEGHRYYLGLGFGAVLARIGGSQSSLDQPAGATGLSPRASFEFSRLNLWGLGHSLNFKSRYSTLDRRASLNYLAPRYRNVEGRNVSFTALYDNTRDVRTFTAVRYEGSAQLSQRVSKATTALWRYTWRDVRVDKNTLKINPGLIPVLSQPSRIGMISASVIQDRRDSPTDAHRGIYNTGDLGLVYHAFGGNRNFLRFLGRNSYYRSVGSDLVLASNTEFGLIRPFRMGAETDAANYVPLPERFFGGGSNSHRGFADNQAGPRDLLTGFSVGGNALLFHSTEIRFPLIGDNIRGVFFHDFGNVYSSLSDISFRYRQRDLTDFNYMVQAAGFGIRYTTPLGPIRVDLAYAFNPPTFNGLKGSYQDLLNNTATPAVRNANKFQFFFSIGQAF